MAGCCQKSILQPVEFAQFLIRGLQFAIETGIFARSLRLFVQTAQQTRIGGAKQTDEERGEDRNSHQQRPLVAGDENTVPGGAECCPDAEQAGEATDKRAKIEQPEGSDQLVAPVCQEAAKTQSNTGKSRKRMTIEM